MPLLGIPMLQRTLSALELLPEVDALVVVVNPRTSSIALNEIVMERIGKVVRGGRRGRAAGLFGAERLAALAERPAPGTWSACMMEPALW